MDRVEFKVVKGKWPSWLSKEYVEELRERGKPRREALALARKILGKEDPPDLNERFINALLNFPEIDCEDDIFARHPGRGDSDVSG
ncbi:MULTISPECIES: hypothetical protein [unclassified Caballeronia]|uniref:hypothetical protein n=1 Tax=unclassified Caballeronia TaxID=2646786 RepID=UPI00285B9AA0|nr:MULTISPECIES: hypothetical protein [unclassified Caballeronia]MDR5812137.1 hypothetical protein [Caballeronia sp. LZ033]MDR5818964.1 hypothetical protein [Caballeronia sp. LZ043]MDR5876760.1 hypothetical protein [Caballeronia sp. LZ032]